MFANCSFKMLLASLALTIGLAAQAAAADFYLAIDGIPGNSRIVPGALDLEGVVYGVDAPTKLPKIKPDNRQSSGSVGSSGMGAGKVSLQDFHFVMKSNHASPLIFKACAQGQHIKQATLTCRKSGGDGKPSTTYLKITLKDVLVSSFAPTANNQDEVPYDDFALVPLQATFEYMNAEGQITSSTTYDLALNKK